MDMRDRFVSAAWLRGTRRSCGLAARDRAVPQAAAAPPRGSAARQRVTESRNRAHTLHALHIYPACTAYIRAHVIESVQISVGCNGSRMSLLRNREVARRRPAGRRGRAQPRRGTDGHAHPLRANELVPHVHTAVHIFNF